MLKWIKSLTSTIEESINHSLVCTMTSSARFSQIGVFSSPFLRLKLQCNALI